ncbi:hypothetical protein Peur_053719 [Populus x canadensis]|uniref:Senescence regulator n=1 Tax=Populus deltoides TaxID=3696 RepID=A0A8T2Z482_POPDE|nr:hypothetical protein H0E87_009373 [Populus deltoides]KAI5590488.1 hypothetical protein BDE02_04G011300 [Populus trichocarpa]
MAKGRRLTASRSERLLGSSYSYGSGHGPMVNDVSELGEEDVWSMVDDTADRNDRGVHNSNWSPRTDLESSFDNMSISSGRRRIPRDDRHMGGLSLAFEDSSSGKNKIASSRIVHQFRGNDLVASQSPRNMATSAPVNVPDWSKIYRVNSVESCNDSDDGLDDHESEMVPPHEYLAREYAQSQKMGGASVVEGVGRTLKGRDMSRVRDAVWSQTGFYG